MATQSIIVNNSSYTKVNTAKLPITIEAKSVAVYVVISSLQPANADLGMFVQVGKWIEFETPSDDVWVRAASETPVDQLVFVTEETKAFGAPTGKGELITDAWGVQKVVEDITLLHGMFTSGIPSETWKESINGVEQVSFLNALSSNGEMILSSNGVLDDEIVLDTFRNPRYQPNRGHRYAISAFIPNKTALCVREFGLFTDYSGVFFRVKSDGLLYVVRRTTVDSVTTDYEFLSVTPDGFDIEKGNTFDIQMQWRGVGNVCFFVGNPSTGASSLIYKMDLLGVLDNLSIFNPALPIAFKCINKGEDGIIKSGCVDVSSEGGESDEGKSYGSVSITNISGQVPITGFNVPVLAVRSLAVFNSLRNTRDIQALLATAYSDQRSFLRVWATRDQTAITLNDQSWVPIRLGNIEVVEYDNPDVVTPMTFDTSKASLIFGARVDQDLSLSTTALFQGVTRIYQTPGDIFIFTMHRETGGAANVGITYEFAEES